MTKLLIRYINMIMIILLVISLASCEKDTTVNLGEPEQQLIVEGRIELLEGVTNHQHEFILSTLGGYFTNTETPRASGAIVWVTNSIGTRFDFQEIEDGRYQNSDLAPVLGERYTLHILWQNQAYEATETLMAAPSIDAIYQQFVEANLFDDEGIKIAIDFTDPSGEDNYYFWETYRDGELQIVANPGNKSNLIATDEFFNGSSIEGYLPNEEILFNPGEQAVVRQIALSKNAYDYYYAVFDQSGKTGALVDTPPIPVRGNIRNLTNPSSYALGYFYASQTAIGVHIIE